MTSQPVVYRVFDADDRLIYIGSTTNFSQRLNHHRANAWWSLIAVRFAVEAHLDVDKARRAEISAIHLEAPAFNQAHNQRRFEDPMPLTDNDLQVAREWVARGGVHLPYPMRWLRDEIPA